jgi:hypothetical protein
MSSSDRPIRLDRHELAWMRRERLREMKIREMMHEVSVFVCLLVLLNVFAWSCVDGDAYHEVAHLRKYLSRGHASMDYEQVSGGGDAR